MGDTKSSKRRDLNQAALGWKARSLPGSRYGANELLGAPDALTGDELQRAGLKWGRGYIYI
jgi:hypothetical protein